MNHKFKLGSELKDTLTGFQAITTARCEYLTQCTQYLLLPTVDKDGKHRDGQWVDETRLELIKEGAYQLPVTTAIPQTPPG